MLWLIDLLEVDHDENGNDEGSEGQTVSYRVDRLDQPHVLLKQGEQQKMVNSYL